MLFVVTLPDKSRRIAEGINDVAAVLGILERYDQFPDKIEVAPWCTLDWENDS